MKDTVLKYPINFEAWSRTLIGFIRHKDLEQELKDWSGGWGCPIGDESERKKMETNLRHWREECGKLNSQVARAQDTNQRLRAALEHLSSRTQSEGLLWWQIEARKALEDFPA